MVVVQLLAAIQSARAGARQHQLQLQQQLQQLRRAKGSTLGRGGCADLLGKQLQPQQQQQPQPLGRDRGSSSSSSSSSRRCSSGTWQQQLQQPPQQQPPQQQQPTQQPLAHGQQPTQQPLAQGDFHHHCLSFLNRRMVIREPSSWAACRHHCRHPQLLPYQPRLQLLLQQLLYPAESIRDGSLQWPIRWQLLLQNSFRDARNSLQLLTCAGMFSGGAFFSHCSENGTKDNTIPPPLIQSLPRSATQSLPRQQQQHPAAAASSSSSRVPILSRIASRRIALIALRVCMRSCIVLF